MILHLDADSFFASCAQALNPAYKGKPVVTGGERSIATSVSYEAKALGIMRGMPVWKIKRRFPQVNIVNSDYRNYSLFSQKMFNIVRRYTPTVEEYSIDEAFVDISGMRRPLKMGYREIGADLQRAVQSELALGVSIGIAPAKVLAKIASGWDKPNGLILIGKSDISDFLSDLPTDKVWGIGPQTASFLRKCGISTAGEFIHKNEIWINKNLTKPHIEIWHELRGEKIYYVDSSPKEEYKSISKTRTFYTPNSDEKFLFAELTKNLENVCSKARRYGLSAKKIAIFLKQHGAGGRYKSRGLEYKFNRPTNIPNEATPLLREMFNQLYSKDLNYRATNVILSELTDENTAQIGLFEDPLELEKLKNLYTAVDEIEKEYGKDTVYLAAGLPSRKNFSRRKRFPSLSLPRL